MSIAPSDQERLALQIKRIYEESEIRLLMLIANRIKDGIDAPEWAVIKLAQLGALRREIQKELGGIESELDDMVLNIIEMAYRSGQESVVEDLKEALSLYKGTEEERLEQLKFALFADEVPATFPVSFEATVASMVGVNKKAVEVLARELIGALKEKHVLVTRQVEDIYKRIVLESASTTLTGAQTRLEMAQTVLNKFLDNGITFFEAKNGRNWNIASYTEMHTRSIIGQASIQGHIYQMQEYEMNLVMVSDHLEECDLCRPYEGKIYSLEDGHSKYQNISVAIAGGLFHPNCGHRALTYIEGLTEPITKTADPDGYKEREKQRYLERGIRHWKRREAMAMTDKEREKAQAKVKEWNGAMSEFIAETGRRRKRNREQIPDVAR